jgi:hypothetical protein
MLILFFLSSYFLPSFPLTNLLFLLTVNTMGVIRESGRREMTKTGHGEVEFAGTDMR